MQDTNWDLAAVTVALRHTASLTLLLAQRFLVYCSEYKSHKPSTDFFSLFFDDGNEEIVPILWKYRPGLFSDGQIILKQLRGVAHVINTDVRSSYWVYYLLCYMLYLYFAISCSASKLL